MKMESSRLQDLADISRMLGYASTQAIETARKVLKAYRPQDEEDFISLLELGRLEHYG